MFANTPPQFMKKVKKVYTGFLYFYAAFYHNNSSTYYNNFITELNNTAIFSNCNSNLVMVIKQPNREFNKIVNLMSDGMTLGMCINNTGRKEQVIRGWLLFISF